MTWLGAIAAVAHKELLVEWRERSRVTGLLFYAFALLLMVAFTAPDVQILARLAGGAVWLGLLLASTRALDQSFRVELENAGLEGLVLWPVEPVAVFYGKALANTVVLVLVAAVLLPLALLLYHPEMRGSWGMIVTIVVLGSLGIATPGTLVAALASQARGSSALLPVLLFPLVVPVVLATARATTLVLEGDPLDQADDWTALLAVFVVVHAAIDGLLFQRVVDEG